MFCIRKMNNVTNCGLFKNIQKKLLIFFPVTLFLILTIYNLHYPGISIDEAGDGIVSNYILKDASIAKQGLMITNYYIVLFNRIFPVMSGDYVGSVFSYLVFPFLHIFGLNAISLRITPIFFSAWTILFIYLFCRGLFDRRVAFLSALLTAVNLVFVQYSRVGLYREEIFIIFFFWAGLFLLGKYSETKKSLFLYLCLFFWGLGFSTKIIFLWYALSITVAYMILGRKFNLLTAFDFRQSIISVLSFCLGSIFIILYNIKKPAITIKIILHSLFVGPFKWTSSDVLASVHINNLAYFANLKTRIPHLIMLLKEDIADKADWGIIHICPIEGLSPVIAGLTLISFVSVLIFTLFSRTNPIKYRVLFLYTIYVTLIALTPFTPSGFDPGHLIILLPFPQIVMALFLNYIWQWARHKKIILISVYSIFLIPVFLFNIWMNIYFGSEMKASGGYRRWSTASYELKDYLDKQKIRPIMFGVGLKETIAFLTNERVVPLILYSKLSLSDLAKEYKLLSFKKEPIFYLTMHSEEYLPNVSLFMKLAQDDGKKIVQERIFLNRAGDPIYWLYKIY